MVVDRHYTITHDVRDVAHCRANMVGAHPIISGIVPSGGSFAVFFHIDDRVKVKVLRQMVDQNYDHIISVSIDGPTSFTRKESETNMQFFTYKQLNVNITRHTYVPHHERVKINGELDQFPKLLTTDPIAQYYDFSVGDVIKITRTFGSAEPYDFYRVVVRAS